MDIWEVSFISKLMGKIVLWWRDRGRRRELRVWRMDIAVLIKIRHMWIKLNLNNLLEKEKRVVLLGPMI